MATQTRVPGAASSEVDFALERFERTAEDRIEVSGRWYGLRGRRFVRPVLNLNAGGSRRRAIALLEHKPWAAMDGEVWLAAFRWPDGAGDVSGAELEVGPGLLVELPALGGKPGGASVRVSALRPRVPALSPWRAGEAGEGHEPAEPESARPREAPHREPSGRAAAPEWTAAPRHAPPESSDGGSSGRAAPPDMREAASGRVARDPSGRAAPDSESGRGSAPDWADAPSRDRGAALDWTDAPPRDRAATPRDRAAPPPRTVVTALTAERDEAIAARDKAEQERVAALQERDDALSRRDAAQRDVDRGAAERDEAIAERDRLTAELERVTRERDIAHAERSRTLQDSEAIARERDQAAAERDAARSELSRALPARDEAIRERDAQAARAEQTERERETAFAERKSAVAQRDRARRERDRAMRAAGVEPPAESPYVSPPAADAPDQAAGTRPTLAPIPGAPAGVSDVDEPAAPDGVAVDPAAADTSATPPGTPLPSRPLKRIGAAPLGPAPEPKPLLTPVDAGRPRRLSRTRRPPSAPARWAVRFTVILLMIAIAVVLVMLLARTL